MRALLILLTASLFVLAFSLFSTGGPARAGDRPALNPIDGLHSPAIRTRCASPRRLRLDRFEDGSAQVRCAGRILVRISVPG
jgi:hypothetical protein